jgi:hypothetical protein
MEAFGVTYLVHPLQAELTYLRVVPPSSETLHID